MRARLAQADVVAAVRYRGARSHAPGRYALDAAVAPVTPIASATAMPTVAAVACVIH